MPYEKILKYWFGHIEETLVPSKHRARIWFGNDSEIDAEMQKNFIQEYEAAVANQYVDWHSTARGQLALILLYDQFSRHFYRNSKAAFEQDAKAVEICVRGIETEQERDLSLIERVFYYFPLLHAEDLHLQQESVFVYKALLDLALPETKGIFDSFLEFSTHHYEVIKRFGRFPQRNTWLGRPSTPAELAYLKEYGQE